MAIHDSSHCSVVVGADLPKSSTVSASAVLLPDHLFRALAIALNDPVEVVAESFRCIGPGVLQPHSSASSGTEVIILASVPYGGHYQLPMAPLSRLPAKILPAFSVPDSFEIAIQTDVHISMSSHFQKLLCCQRMVVRPGSVFTLYFPGRGPIQCSVLQCHPSTSIITPKTTIRLSTHQKLDSMAAKHHAYSERDLVLGPAFVRLCSFLRLSSWRPKGILLYGPPGVGKSLILDVAGLVTNSSILHVSGHDLAAMTSPGDAERSLSETFSAATDTVCIDAIERIAGKRGALRSESSRILGQLLTLMAGVNANNVVVIGIATNPQELDPAVRRAGRFDQEIEVPVPDIDQRDAILRFYLPGLSKKRIRRIAERSVGYTGADIYSLVQESALSAAFNDRAEITQDDIESAFTRVCVSSSRRDAIVKIQPTRWDDIGGYDEIKSKLQRLIQWPIQHPDEYRLMGLQLPRGLLLYGPPGCAKTTLARALVFNASESWSILKLDAASVYSSFVGDAEASIRRAFTQARSNLPCMLLLDEIDAIVTSRGLQSSGSERVQERILSTLLNEMDGISGADQILVVASTNRPQMLDDALLRPGRFDHLFHVGFPDASGRLEILKIHTKSMPLTSDVDLNRLACFELVSYTGAEIENVCREAALHALRSNIDNCAVSMEDFQFAVVSIKPGLTSELCQIYNDFERAVGLRKA